MRFMILIKADEHTETGVLPSEQLLTEMSAYNEALVNAGVMVAGEGLHPSSRGVRVRFSGGRTTVIDGPFTDTRELLAGFWLWNFGSREEGRRASIRGTSGSSPWRRSTRRRSAKARCSLTPELREREERLRARATERNLEATRS